MNDELFPKKPNPLDPTNPEEIRFEDVDSATPELDTPAVISPDFAIDIVELPADGPAIKIQDETIFLDKDRLKAEMVSVTDWLVGGVESGDETVLEVYLRNLPGTASEDDVSELKSQLETAFETKDASGLKLDELHVNVVSAGIAERNLIREGIRPELLRQPFYFRDKQGNVLSGESDLDIVFARDDRRQGSGYRVIVGSRQGIDAIVIPKELPADKFVPDMTKMTKDELRDIITIPLKQAADGTMPSAATIEIHRDPVDLIEDLARQERVEAEQEARRERDRQEEEERQRRQYSPPPPSPRPGNWSSHSG